MSAGAEGLGELPAAAQLFLGLVSLWADGRLTDRGLARALEAAGDAAAAEPSQPVSGREAARRARALRTRDPSVGSTLAGRPATTKRRPLREELEGHLAPSPLELLEAAEDRRAERAWQAARLHRLRSVAKPAERRALRAYWRSAHLAPTDRVPLSAADRSALRRLVARGVTLPPRPQL